MDKFNKYIVDAHLLKKGVYTHKDVTDFTIEQRLDKFVPDFTSISTEKKLYDFLQFQYEEDYTFSNMSKYDITFLLLIGTIGALSSAFLREPFSKLHDPVSDGGYGVKSHPVLGKIRKYLEHPGDLMDKEIGPLTHRIKYGHDIFNFKEIKECIGSKIEDLQLDGDSYYLKTVINSVAGYIKHIFADSFSKQGLPVPGSTRFREELIEMAQRNQELYQSLFTLKHRDLVGAGLVAALTKVYKKSRGINADCYKYYEINILAQAWCFILGLFVQYIPRTELKSSLNYFSLVAISIDFIRANRLSNKIRNQIVNNTSDRLLELRKIATERYNIEEDKLRFLLEDV